MSHKYEEVATTIRRRILSGDFNFKQQLSGRIIAAETGVSYLTARRALQLLQDDGVFIQKDNGRLELNENFQGIGKKLQVALLQPNWFSMGMHKWVGAIREIVGHRGGILRTVTYSHNDDPSIAQVFDSDFDLIFLWLDKAEKLTLSKMKNNHKRIINLFTDRTDLGITSLDGPSPEAVSLLIKHLTGLKHKKFASLCTEPESRDIKRAECWEKCMSEAGLTSWAINEPVKPFEDATVQAYKIIRKLLAEGKVNFTALFSTSVNTAKAAMRAFYEAGYKIGRDISICSFGDPTNAQLSIPSITVVDMPDPFEVVEKAFNHVISKKQEAKMFRIQHRKLFTGESTGEYIK